METRHNGCKYRVKIDGGWAYFREIRYAFELAAKIKSLVEYDSGLNEENWETIH